MSLKAKMTTFCLLIGLLPLVVMGILSVSTASSSLSDQAFGQLTSVRDMKAQAVDALFEKWFSEAAIYGSVKEVYNTLVMIREYAMDNAEDGKPMPVDNDEYKEIHEYVAKPFLPFLDTLGYEDALVIDDYGRVLFTAAKGKDLGADLANGRLKSTGLAKLWKRVMAGETVFADYEPYPPLGNAPAAFIGTPVKSGTGEIQGAAVLRIPLEHINKLMVLSTGMGATGVSYLVGPDGLMRSDLAGDMARHSVASSFADPDKGKARTEAVALALGGQSGVGIMPGIHGRDNLVAYRPVQAGETSWALISEIGEDEAFGPVRSLRLTALVLGLVTALIVIAATLYILKRELIGPFNSMMGFVTEISAGNFAAELTGRFKAETKVLADGIRAMVAELKNKLGFSEGILKGLTVPCLVADPQSRISFVNRPMMDLLETDADPETFIGLSLPEILQRGRDEQEVVSRCYEEKRAIVGVERAMRTRRDNERTVRIDAAPLYDLDGTSIGAFAMLIDMTDIRDKEGRISTQNEKMSAVANQATDISGFVSEDCRKLSSQTRHVSDGAKRQTKRLEEATSAIEEMNQALLEAAHSASDAVRSAGDTLEKAQEGAEVMHRSTEAIQRVNRMSSELRGNMHALGEKAQSIGGIISVINDIADQTNLLALNAAIEAARAGEAGRGFAVVADEVRKLAEKTVAATKEVADSVKAIQDSARQSIAGTDKAVEAVEEASDLVAVSGEALRAIAELSRSTSARIKQIAQVSEEQSEAHDEITRTVEEIRSIASETESEMEKSAQAVESLVQTSDQLQYLIQDLKAA